MIILNTTIPITPFSKQSTTFAKGKAYTNSKKKKDAERFILEFYSNVSKKDINLIRSFINTTNDKDLYIEANVIYNYKFDTTLTKKRINDLISLFGYVPKNTTPDIMDNLNKSIFDCLSKILNFNDGRICKFNAVKRYNNKDSIEINLKFYNIKNDKNDYRNN